jgi:hypothetical protein
VAAQAGVPQLAASSLKAALDADWDDLAARDAALAEVLGLLDRVGAFVTGQAGDEAASAAVATARQVRDQDIDLTGPAPALRRGVARGRRISVEDAEMRHGRKSRSVLFDGYKRHVLRDLDTGLVPAVGITPANAPEASVTDAITADLQAAGRTLSELHIDRAYLASALVRDRSPDLAIFCKAWRVRNTGGRFAKDQFTLDLAAGQLTCPAGVTMRSEPGTTVRFPERVCAACPLRARCTTSSNGRSVSIHPDEALLAELRQRQQTPEGRVKLRERVAVEHALAHVGHWQGRRARYRGTRKNLFDLRRVAVVHNLHIIARQPVTGSYQLATLQLHDRRSRHPPRGWCPQRRGPRPISTGSPDFRQGCQPRLAESGLMLIRHDVTAVAARAATAMLPAGLATTPSCWTELTCQATHPREPDRTPRSGRAPALGPARSRVGDRHAGIALAGGRARARCAPGPGEDQGRRQAGGSTRFPACPIIHSRHQKMQIPYLARHGRVVTFDGRGSGRSDLRRPGYQRGHRGTPRPGSADWPTYMITSPGALPSWRSRPGDNVRD